MRECFGTLLDDDFFLNWLANSVGYKLCSLKNLITVKTPISRKNYHVKQEVYDFWLQNSITSNDSANSTKRVSNINFLKSFKDITDPQVQEEVKTPKKGSTVKMMVATKGIYTDSVRKLLQRFNETQEKPISLSTFFKLKPFYCLRPSEKEKQSCLCLNCLNPHVILK